MSIGDNIVLASVLIIFLIIIIIPFLATIILGVYFANMLGLTGVVWWSFVILFYLIVSGVLGFLTIKKE